LKIAKKIRPFLFPVLLIQLITPGCSPKQSDKEPALKTDSLINLMAEIQLTEARLTQERGKGRKTDSLARVRYDSLFASYKMSKKKYEDQLKKLTANPEEYIRIYDSVITRLERLKQEQPEKETKQ